MFSDVPNPPIYYLDLFFWRWLNCDINQELRKHLLFWYFDLTNSVKAFSSFCTRHCKRVLVPVMSEVVFFFPPRLLFGQIIRCDVEQTSEDFIGPGIKLADSLTHLTTGKAMKPLWHWFRSTTCQQDFFFLSFFLKSTRNGVSFHQMYACFSNTGFIYLLFLSFFVVATFAL